MIKRLFNPFAVGFCGFLCVVHVDRSVAAEKPAEYRVYIGTYTGPKSKGIYSCKLDTKTGRLSTPTVAAETLSPSFLAIDPKSKFLYAANETDKFEGKRSGAVTVFSIDADSGKLTLLNQQPSGGDGPCHVSVDKTGKVVLVANYGGGSISSYPVGPDGALGVAASFIQHKGASSNPQRQEGPHAHCIGVDPGNARALVADLGLDKILIYKLDPATAVLTPNDPPDASVSAGSGPRHFAFTPNGRFLYLISELACTVTGFAYDSLTGSLKQLQTISSLPGERNRAYSTAEIEVHPSGKFVYGSNRGHDSIVVFSIDPETGKLTLVQHQPSGGKTPRSFGIDPSGTFLLAANQDSNNVVVFKIDPDSGRLSATGQEVQVGAPVCVKFVALQ